MQNKSRFLIVLGLLFLAAVAVWSPLPHRPSAARNREQGETASGNSRAAATAPGRAEETPAPQLTNAVPQPAVPVNWAGAEMRQEILWQKPAPEAAFAVFQKWTERYASADEAGKSALAAEGRQLAEARLARLHSARRH